MASRLNGLADDDDHDDDDLDRYFQITCAPSHLVLTTHLYVTMSRTTRSSKSTAPSPAPLSHIHSAKAMETLEKAVQETGIEVDEDALPSHAAPAGDVEENEAVAERAKGKAKGKGTAKGKGKGKATSEDEEEAERERAVEAEQAEVGRSEQSGRVSPEERLAKLKELRMRMVSLAVLNTAATLLTYLSSHFRTNPRKPTANP
jgi:hypothetical protein